MNLTTMANGHPRKMEHQRQGCSTLICMIALIFLAGCAGRDNSPRWRANAAAEMESYDRYALEGHPALAAVAYRKAAEALKLGADVQGLARAALRRCAVESVTGDKKQDCKDYAALRDVSGGGDLDAYARWMTHSILPGDAELLPEPQREIARAWLLRDENGIIRALERIESSLSFLVAFSVVHAQVVEPLSLLDRCRDLTAREGWVAAHRECLRREQRWHEKRGASREAERVERLIKALQP